MAHKSQIGVRMAVIYLSVSYAVVGLWATFATRDFYDNFPGPGHHWLAGDGPYNAHLVTDAGVGFLAVGVVLMLAAIWWERRLVQAALVAVIVHDLPHLVFHLRHQSPALRSLDRSMSAGGIAFQLLIAAVALVVITVSADQVRSRQPGPAVAR